MNKDIELHGCFAVTFFLLFWHLIVIHLANPLKKPLQCAWRVKKPCKAEESLTDSASFKICNSCSLEPEI